MGDAPQISTHRRYPLPPHTSHHLGFLPTRLPYWGLPLMATDANDSHLGLEESIEAMHHFPST
jgi:hypothetical protein